MEKYIDSKTGQEYVLYVEDRKALAGYYYSHDPYPALLFCAATGRWFEWKPDLQEWQREQEWCRFYYDRRNSLLKIKNPVDYPSPENAVQAEIKIAKEKLERWREKQKPTWWGKEIPPFEEDIQLNSDGSCYIQDGDWEYDIPLGIVPHDYYLDADATKKLFETLNLDLSTFDDRNPKQKRKFFNSFWNSDAFSFVFNK